MKRILIIALILATGLTVSAQKFAFVDTEYILNNIPSYNAAQSDLEAQASEWQQEIELRYKEIEKMYREYQAEKVLLTEEMKKEREDEIVRKEQEAKELQRQRFGVDGDLFKRRQELIQPIQDDVYNAIKEVAQGGGFSVMFDKANQSNILYADPRYDKSDRVLSRLGVSAKDREANDDDSGTDSDSGNNQNSNPNQRNNSGGDMKRK